MSRPSLYAVWSPTEGFAEFTGPPSAVAMLDLFEAARWARMLNDQKAEGVDDWTIAPLLCPMAGDCGP